MDFFSVEFENLRIFDESGGLLRPRCASMLKSGTRDKIKSNAKLIVNLPKRSRL
jgi:hypothetical protein